MGGRVRVAAAGIAVVGLMAFVLDMRGTAAIILETLVVRVYDSAGVLAGDRARAMKSAHQILASADVYIDWRDCPAGGALIRSACSAPARGDLAVRLVRAPTGDPNPRVLGSALIDATTGSGTLATIYVDRVQAAAREGRADTWAMAGRVMAHEIGHLLLGTNAHADTGLMREIWSVKDLLRNRAEDWLFSRAQRDRLRTARRPG